jgi:hypothetical protein
MARGASRQRDKAGDIRTRIFFYPNLVFYIKGGGDYTPDLSGSVTDSTQIMRALADGQF